jgi:hypothetical protein
VNATQAAARRLPPNAWLTLSLAIATFVTAWPQPRDGTLAFLVLAATTFASTRFRIGPIALIVLFAIGVELRVAQFGIGFSDVSDTIRAAINEVLAGLNPYAPIANRPPFPYGPLALIWYLPINDPRMQEFGLSIVMLGVLAIRGKPMGLAIFATMPLFVLLASDGSNDHTAALFLLVALLVLERAPRAGALLLGLSAGFKIYSLAWLPPVFFWVGVGSAGAVAIALGVVGFLIAWLPAAVLWGPGNILSAIQAADAVHKAPFFSLGETLLRLGINASRQVLDVFRLLAGAATALIVSPFVRTFSGVVIGGMLIYFVTLYAGYWSTPAYLIAPILVICWFIDAWLGPDGSRIEWPSDPVGRLSVWVDRRWPTVDATRISRP